MEQYIQFRANIFSYMKCKDIQFRFHNKWLNSKTYQTYKKKKLTLILQRSSILTYEEYDEILKMFFFLKHIYFLLTDTQ